VSKTLSLFGAPWRELWLPRDINGSGLPSAVPNGHPLTLTGARKGTTVNGVHFTGANNSNINCGAIHNGATKLWISFRFKLDQDHTTGDGDKWVWSKRSDATNKIYLRLTNADGKLRFYMETATVERFDISSAESSWTAGVWYHVLASISSANAVRLLIDNGTPVTDGDVNAYPAAGDFVIGDNDDPGSGAGFIGTIADFVVGTDDLSSNEETDLYKGSIPGDAVEFWPLDEGRGTVATDRGSGGNDGTLDTAASWSFGATKQPVLSVDGINDRGQSSTGVDISGPVTVVWVGKMKSTYGALNDNHHRWLLLRIGNADELILDYSQSSDEVRFYTIGDSSSAVVVSALRPAIDDYWILIGTLTLAGAAELLRNGVSIGTASGAGEVSAAAATAYLGSSQTPNNFDMSKCLLAGLIDGALSGQEALNLSRRLNEELNLGITI